MLLLLPVLVRCMDARIPVLAVAVNRVQTQRPNFVQSQPRQETEAPHPVPAARAEPAEAAAPTADDAVQHFAEFSITIGKRGTHVIPGWLDMWGAWCRSTCLAGLASLEIGKREGHLHIQAIARVPMLVGQEVTQSMLNLLRNQMKAAMGVRRSDGSACTISIAAFGPGQEWLPMCGYCTKDMVKPHHRKVTHNVTDEQINAGSPSLVSPTSHMYDYISN